MAMLRIKNGILFVEECLEKISRFCDEIIICDNGSTDGTLEIYKKFPKIKEIIKTEGYNEGRDKILLHNMCLLRKPNWILWIDVDEIFEDTINRQEIEEELNTAKFRGCDSLFFDRYHFWMDKKYYRVDERWQPRYDRCIFKNEPSKYFINSIAHNGIVQGINSHETIHLSKFKLKHYGHITTKLNKQKQDKYREVDNPNNANWTGRTYNHMNENKPEIQLKKWVGK